MAEAASHAAVSPYLTSRRLWQQMVNGTWLDFYCVGPLQRQEDRTGLDRVGEIYRFHAANKWWLQGTMPAGELGLVRRGENEYEGILQILCENQIALELTGCSRKELARFPLVIVPDTGGLDRQELEPCEIIVFQFGEDT